MGVFTAIGDQGHEEVLFGSDEKTGLRTIIAIHSTALGPALGGTRFFPYRTDDEALADVLRLAKGMTYKAALAGLDQGGGKAVIIGDPRTMKTEALIRSYGMTVDSLGGRYITAEDVGTTAADMVTIAKETAHVAGLPTSLGGSGDPSPATARGVVLGIQAAAHAVYGTEDLSQRSFAVQGVGKVGSAIVRLLAKEGAAVTISDIDTAAVDALVMELGVTAVAADDIYDVAADVFVPCALGGTINRDTITKLRCSLIAGSANNQLREPEDSERLRARDITYVPDFVTNSGGIINIAQEAGGYSPERADEALGAVHTTVTEILQRSARSGLDPVTVAEHIAEERIAAVSGLHTRTRAHARTFKNTTSHKE